MHPFPATDPFPVARIALIAVDDVGRTFRFTVRHQRREDRGSFSMLSFPLLMVRQDIDGMMERAFQEMDNETTKSPQVIEIRPHLVFV